MDSQQQPDLLNALSMRLEAIPPGLRDQVFASAKCGAIRVERHAQTILHAELESLPAGRWQHEAYDEIAWVARCHGGDIEPIGPRAHLVRFESPRSALRSAMVLQRISPHSSLRLGIGAGLCFVASFPVGEEPWQLTFGSAAEQAAHAARSAVPGTITLCSAACQQLGPELEEEARSGLISLELDGSRVVQATVSLPPRRSAALSSFAGLGLV